MEFTIHHQILTAVFVVAIVMGAVANKTNFCTMGAVSDWINMGDAGRLRAWLLAMAVAILGVAALTGMGLASIGNNTFPPYRTPNFAWLRYLLGGLMFGVGMTLASGCGNKTLVRVGGGNLKSLVVLAIASACAYLMLWTDFYGTVFNSWIAATTIDLGKFGMNSQAVSELFGSGAQVATGAAIGLALAGFAFASKDFRGSFDNILGGLVIGLAVVIGWYLTAGPIGAAWKEWAELADTVPSRVEVQSYTFISPMGDSVRYLTSPSFANINFGITALVGVIAGSFLYAILSGSFRIEWFVSGGDFLNHAVGAVLMGIGGVLSMGCTVGQAITGMSTLAMGSMLTFIAIVAGAAATMKFQYWRMMREA
ncbi:MAG: YeeE/YedE family protein [Betaproteobacteria bacterium]|nr:YeeE/YedE family protein [Betaproteobacteria bacterium]